MNDAEIDGCIEGLRGGGTLTRESVTAVAIAINRKFEELAKLWGGKRFTIPASVAMRHETYLHFCRVDRLWRFRIIHKGQAVEMPDASLEQRQAAVECLDELERALLANADLDRGRLIAAYDAITKYAEEAIDD